MNTVTYAINKPYLRKSIAPQNRINKIRKRLVFEVFAAVTILAVVLGVWLSIIQSI